MADRANAAPDATQSDDVETASVESAPTEAAQYGSFFEPRLHGPVTNSAGQWEPRVDTRVMSEVNVYDLYMFRKFCISANAILPDPDSRNLFHDMHDPTYLAFRHQYLLHAILALAAIQEWSDSDREDIRKLDIAIGHYDNAIILARPFLVRVGKDYAESLYWLTIYTTLFSLAETVTRPLTPTTRFDYIKELLRILRYCRATKSCLAELPPDHTLQSVENRQYLTTEREIRAQVDHDYPQLRHVKILARDRVESGLTAAEAEDCVAAADSVFVMLFLLRKYPQDRLKANMLLTWAMDLLDSFYDLCRLKKSVPMIILSWYALAMHHRPEMWFLKGWPVVLVRACEIHLRRTTLDIDFYIGIPSRTIIPAELQMAARGPINLSDVTMAANGTASLPSTRSTTPVEDEFRDRTNTDIDAETQAMGSLTVEHGTFRR